MADHYVGISRGITGTKGIATGSFTVGAGSTGALTVELRVTDSAMTNKDVMLALEAFEIFFANAQLTNSAGFVFLNN